MRPQAGERDGAAGAVEDARLDRLVAESPAARAAVALARRAAGSEIPVLFQGESGAGKEVFARALHAASARAAGPFVAVNCGAIPENLVEATLFGHERGAFTGAVERRRGKFTEAEGGSLFLDEIGDLPLAAQVKLLRAVQDRAVEPVGGGRAVPVDIRILTATHRDLRREVAEGRFREDLFYRIAAFEIRVPPLRERRADIAPLARRLLGRLAAAEGATPPALAPEALRLLEAAPWPGNVRELQNALHRATVLADGGTLRAAHFATGAAFEDQAAAPAATEVLTLAEIEAAHIRFALEACGWRMSETARRLGIGRSTLYRKLAELGLAGRE